MDQTVSLENVMNAQTTHGAKEQTVVNQTQMSQIVLHITQHKTNAKHAQRDCWCHMKTHAECARMEKKQQTVNACNAVQESIVCFLKFPAQVIVLNSHNTAQHAWIPASAR